MFVCICMYVCMCVCVCVYAGMSSTLDGAPPDDAIAKLFSSSSSSREPLEAASSAALPLQGGETVSAEERESGQRPRPRTPSSMPLLKISC